MIFSAQSSLPHDSMGAGSRTAVNAGSGLSVERLAGWGRDCFGIPSTQEVTVTAHAGGEHPPMKGCWQLLS